MENRLRDLEFIQERARDDRGRRIGIGLLATLTLIGLTFAMGVVVGRAAKPENSEVKDPLAHLDNAIALKAREEDKKKTPPKVNREELTFPITLTDQEDRPEVEAALAAAAAEEAQLSKLDGRTTNQSEPSKREVKTQLPASVVVGSSNDRIKKTAKLDPLVKAAMREPAGETPAPAGQDGEFTLQVISFDTPEPARAFAEGLRARGHQAYIISADVPGRGRYYRVRIGPFASKAKAESYRHRFEESERMSTYLVQRRNEKD
jgi:DedD protein